MVALRKAFDEERASLRAELAAARQSQQSVQAFEEERARLEAELAAARQSQQSTFEVTSIP